MMGWWWNEVMNERKEVFIVFDLGVQQSARGVMDDERRARG